MFRAIEHLLTPHRLLWASVAVAGATIVLKTLAWHLTGSVALLSDAMEAFVNLAGAMFALLMVTIAQRPADEGHPFGHSKAEYFSSGFEGILIIGAAFGIGWTAVSRLFNPLPLEQLGWGMGLSVASTALNALLAMAMGYAARLHRSIALEADSRHLMTDVWTSVGVWVGVIAATLSGWYQLDALVAIAVALNILREGVRLLWRGAQGLMDEAVDAPTQHKIDDVLAGFASSDIRFDHVRTRRAGQHSFVDLHMHVPAAWPLGRAAAQRVAVEQALMNAAPGLYASIQLLPSNAESYVESLRAQAEMPPST